MKDLYNLLEQAVENQEQVKVIVGGKAFDVKLASANHTLEPSIEVVDLAPAGSIGVEIHEVKEKTMDEAKRKAIEKAVVDNNGELPSWVAAIRSDDHTIMRDEFEQVKAEMQNKPSWSDAPEWAEWLAQGSIGCWSFYQEKPKNEESETIWLDAGGNDYFSDVRVQIIGGSRTTLEKRPKPNLDELSEREPTPELRELMGGDWHERGERVRYPSGEGVLIVPEPDNNGVVIVLDEEGEYRLVAKDNIRTKRDKLIEQACHLMNEHNASPFYSVITAAANLIDAGWRPPKN